MQLANHAWQYIQYGVLKKTPNIDFSELPANIHLESGYDEKNGVHWVVAPELPEFIVTGKTSEELARNVGDTILVYFDVPAYFAKKYQDGELTFTNRKTGEVERIQVNKKELDKVLA